jgi:hypothetical protein
MKYPFAECTAFCHVVIVTIEFYILHQWVCLLLTRACDQLGPAGSGRVYEAVFNSITQQRGADGFGHTHSPCCHISDPLPAFEPG